MLHLSMYFKSESFYLLNVNKRIFLDSREDDVYNDEKEDNGTENRSIEEIPEETQGEIQRKIHDEIHGDTHEGSERMHDITPIDREIFDKDNDSVSLAEIL